MLSHVVCLVCLVCLVCFLPTPKYHPPEKARILSELLLLLPHQNFWFMVSKDHIFWPDKVENLSVKLSYKPEIIGKIRVGTSMSSARRPDFLTDFFVTQVRPSVGTWGAVGGSNWQYSLLFLLPCFVAKVHHKFWTCPAASFPRQKVGQNNSPLLCLLKRGPLTKKIAILLAVSFFI